MAIITLTSDMGLRDFYLASVKGAILGNCPEAHIVDISHDIRPFDIAQASFVLKSCYRDFPKGSIHVIGVMPDADLDTSHLLVEMDGHYFIGADNGIFSLLFDRNPDKIFELTVSQDSDRATFAVRDVFVKAACHLARGGTPEVIGQPKGEIKIRQMFRPVVEENAIRGTIIYVDTYGNVISNITEELFDSVGRGRPFLISMRRGDYDIREISQSYGEVPEGERLALFNSSGYLQISINKGVEGAGGGASRLFGLKLNDVIGIDFKEGSLF